MARNVISTSFDYSSVPAETKGKLITLAGQVRRGREHYNNAVIELGESINEAHGLLANHHKGSFGKWIESECGLEERTAYNYMWAWQRFGSSEIISRLSATAMYLLAAPEAPKEAAKEAEKLANKGEKITVARAKEIIEKFKEPRKAPSKPKPEPVETESAEPAPQPESAPIAKGDCPKGGDHEFDKSACKKCHEPSPTIKIPGGTDFPVDVIEAAQAADEAAKPQNPQEQLEATAERFDAILNHLKQAKTIATKLTSEQVTGAWLMERWASAKVELDNLWTTFSALKPGMLCPRCKGSRCDYCKGTGHMTASFARQRKGA